MDATQPSWTPISKIAFRFFIIGKEQNRQLLSGKGIHKGLLTCAYDLPVLQFLYKNPECETVARYPG
jgi:hypothetical protein